MRFRKQKEPRTEGDLTPMIDMTFQLIAFFMVLINFTEAEQNDRIKLPLSTLAKPPEAPFEYPIYIQLTRNGTVLLSGEEVPLSGLKPYMIREADFLKLKDKSLSDSTVVIRADADAPTGQVQEIIKICQESKFETFALRAREEIK